MPMLRLSGDRLVRAAASKTVRSPKEIRPVSGVSRPAKHRRVVVFPHPLGPSNTMNSPCSISRSRSSLATVGGLALKCLVNPSILT